jgi:hypothetical protein
MKNIVNVSEYQYGRINKRLRNIAKWLNGHQNSIKKKLNKGEFDLIDYPDYWGIPSKLSNSLDTDELDFLQFQTYDFFEKNYKEADDDYSKSQT